MRSQISRKEVYQEMVDILNELLEIDANAMNALLQFALPVNKGIVEHPSVMCHGRTEDTDQVVLRVIGIFNGITQPHGYAITADYEDTEEGTAGDLIGFSLREVESLHTEEDDSDDETSIPVCCAEDRENCPEPKSLSEEGSGEQLRKG